MSRLVEEGRAMAQPAWKSVQDMFSEVALQRGPQVALERGERRVTYAELEASSNNLANFLLATGTSKGAPCGISALDPIDWITCLLATLKAGCLFVPLD